jgi:hypothetical protein
LDDVRVTPDVELGISLLDIPNLDGEISGRGGEDVVGNGGEADASDLSLVSREGLNRIVQVAGETTLGDLPNLSIAVFGAGGDEALVEGVEVKVENISRVTDDEGNVGNVELSGLVLVENAESSSSSSIPNATDVLGVGSHLV